MMKKILSVILAVLTCVSLASCLKGNEKYDMKWAEDMNSVKVTDVRSTMAENTFDTRLMKYISEHTEGNYMLSPVSFRYALGLLLAGAEGETEAELLNALGVESKEEWMSFCREINGFSQLFAEQLEKEIETFNYEKGQGWIPDGAEEPFRALRIANSVWKRADITEDFTEAFKETAGKDFAAEYAVFKPDNAVKLINEWADKKTQGMIPHLLPDDYDTDDLAIVLMNALYYKNSWKESFPDYATEEGDFAAANGEITKKEYMNQVLTVPYYSDGDTQLVIIHMEGGVKMAFVIGDTSDVAEKISSAVTHSVKVKIPKIDLETSFDGGELVDFLKEYGVSRAFTDEADFSGMIDRDICVSDIIQKTKIKLDEDGVEAAAVTAILECDCAELIEPEDPFVFSADRPFSFYIYTTVNENTTAIFFSGEIRS